MPISRRLLFVSLALLVVVGCGPKTSSTSSSTLPASGSASGSSALKMGIIPFEDVDKIETAFQPFAEYTGKKCGFSDGKVFVTPSYAGVLQALKSDQIDCAYLNPLSYTLAVQEFKDTPEHLIPIAMPYFHGSLTYKGIIFVRADSPIKTVADFKGKSFVFGDRTSTSGYLYPAGLMKEAGIDPDKDVKAVNSTGIASVQAVLNGQADGGATYETGIETAFTDKATKKIDENQVKKFRIVAKTDPIPNGMIVVRGNLDPAVIEKLKKAMADVNTEPDGKTALTNIPWDKIVPADDKIFDSVRQKAKILGLSLQSLDEQKKP